MAPKHPNIDADIIRANFPEISYKEIEEDYHIDWYDGPLSGIVKYKSERYYYTCIDEVEEFDLDCESCLGAGQVSDSRLHPQKCMSCSHWVRIMGLYRITQDALEREDYWEHLYRFCVYNPLITDVFFGHFMFKFYYARNKKDYVNIDLQNEISPIGWFKW